MVQRSDLEDWRTAELSRVLKPAANGCPARMVKGSTANRKLNALKGLLTYAFDTKVISENLGAKMAKLDEGSGIVRWLRPDEEVRLRAALRERDAKMRAGCPDLEGVSYVDCVEPCILLSLNTGLRRGELLQLRSDDVDLHMRLLTVRDETSKTNRTRYIPLCAEAVDSLTGWIAQQRRGNVRSLLLFPNAAGDRLREIEVFGAIKKLAQVVNFRWHDLRHSFATRLAQHGVPLDRISEWMGHSRLEQTMRYRHFSPANDAFAISALDRAREQAMQQAA